MSLFHHIIFYCAACSAGALIQAAVHQRFDAADCLVLLYLLSVVFAALRR